MKLKELMENQALRNFSIHNYEKHNSLVKLRKSFKWDDVVGNFDIRGMDILSLRGCPKEVNDFIFKNNHSIRSLKYGPKIVHGDFSASNNKFLSDISDIPRFIGGELELDACDLDNDSLQHLPKFIGSNLVLDNNPRITNLHNIHMYVHQIGGILFISPTIKSHIMGLMKIRGLKQIFVVNHYGDDSGKAVEIMNRHLNGQGNFFDCLEELEDAGLEEFAQL